MRFWLANCSWRCSIASACFWMLRTNMFDIMFWVIRIGSS
jgi:hypothetical protein